MKVIIFFIISLIFNQISYCEYQNIKFQTINKNKISKFPKIYLDFKSNKNFIKKTLSNSDININGYFPSIDIFDYGNISSHYGFSNVYSPNDMARIDVIGVNTNINPGVLVNNIPFLINIKSKSTMLYARFYTDPLEAKLALPPVIKYLPVNANNAIKQLKIGEIFGFETNLNLSLNFLGSTGILAPEIPIGLKSSVFLILSGTYFCQIQALKDNRFRIRLKTKKAITGGGDISIGSTYTLTRVEYINKNINNIMSFDFIDSGILFSKDTKFIIDYVFDFNTKEGRIAFDKILSPKQKIKNLSRLTKNIPKIIKQGFISNLSYADKIQLIDVNKPIHKRKVMRFFKGNAKSITLDQKNTFNFILYKMGYETKILNNRIFMEDNITGLETEYRYPVKVNLNTSNYSFGLFRKLKVGLVSTLLKPTKNNNSPIDAIIGQGMLYVDREHFFNHTRLKDVRAKIRRTTPKSIYTQVNWNNDWELSKNKIKGQLNGIIVNIIIIKGKAFKDLKGLTLNNLKREYKIYYSTLNKHNLINRINPIYWNPLRKRNEKKMLKILSKIFSSNPTKKDIRKFIELRNMKLYKDIGMGFILHLLEQNNLPLEDYFFYIISMRGPNSTPMFFRYGNNEKIKDFLTLLKLELGLIYESTDYSQVILD